MNEKKIKELQKKIDDIQNNVDILLRYPIVVDNLIRHSMVLTKVIEKYLNKGSL